MQIQTIGAARTMSTREIAELVNSTHDSVLKTTRRLIAEGVVSGNETLYTHPQNSQQYPEILMDFRNSLVVASGYSSELRARVIDRWQELEAAARRPIELSRMDILRLAMESEEAKLKAEAERDEAIRTKAMIGSRREATAMATASAAKREASKLREELGACARHATITAVEIATGNEYGFAAMRRWCKANGATPTDVPDKRFGKVKAWPAAAWAICHDVDLSALFGEGAA